LSATALSIAAATMHSDAAILKPVEIANNMTCQIIESAAAVAGVPVSLLTRLVWTESHFHPDVISAAGAEGIAQFMPETAAERGLANPFDPEQAIPRAAELLADLTLRFGNIGLAAAAYDAGPSRLERWLAGTGHLALETRAYVVTLTGRTVDDWARNRQRLTGTQESVAPSSCLAIAASLRAKEGQRTLAMASDLPFEANFLTAIALARFDAARQRYCFHLDAQWREMRVATHVRDTAVLDNLLPPLCSAYSRSAHDRPRR
jgi:hypothetical protein